MTIIDTSQWRWRTMAGATLAAGATAIGLLGAAPAYAAGPFIGLAISRGDGATPVGAFAIAPGGDEAQANAQSSCVSRGGQQCNVQIITIGCGAIAVNGVGDFKDGTDTTLRRAEEEARNAFPDPAGARILVSGCANGSGHLPAQPPAPAPPKLGPTVSFKTILGGLQADITDRSGVASQCTYAMDDVNRSFALAANSTFPLKIVPLIPRFQDRSVTISCDNYTKTEATTRF